MEQNEEGKRTEELEEANSFVSHNALELGGVKNKEEV